LSRPDGSELRIECYGREDGPPIILTHGWGANSTEWDYLKKELAGDFQLIVWDLPGLGRSTRPTNLDYSMENRGSGSGLGTDGRPTGDSAWA
jgi:pimeloyl-ACP methyl ester carboxylesterase